MRPGAAARRRAMERWEALLGRIRRDEELTPAESAEFDRLDTALRSVYGG